MPSIKYTSPLLRYGVAVLAVGIVLLVKLLLDPLIVQGTPFLLVFGAIMVSAWYGGLGPGLLATFTGGLAADYFFLPPTGSFSGFSLETAPLPVFFLEGALLCMIVEVLRVARSRAEGSRLEAERQRERLRRNEEHFRSLVEGMRDHAIFTLDPKGRVASWNAGAERLEGYSSEEILGKDISMFLNFQAFARHNSPDSAKGREELDEVRELAREVVGEARQVIQEVNQDLRPTVLDDYGLAAAVRLQIESLRSEGLEVSFEVALGDERLPPEVETTLFRVAQEALTNVRKHARASRMPVVLVRSGSAVRLQVRDEGRGFTPDETAKNNSRGKRVGVSGMRERLSLLGEQFALHSEPGSGTTITAAVELPESREDYDHAG
jgi:PAS domain S-box-containing protein